jgi:hypothetical protein
MAGIVAIVCTAGIAFCLRFLVELLREGRRASVGMFVRLNTVAGDDSSSSPQQQSKSTAQAA